MCVYVVFLYFILVCVDDQLLSQRHNRQFLFLNNFPHNFATFLIKSPLEFSNFTSRSIKHVMIKNTLNDHRKKICNTDRATFLRATTPKNWRLRDSATKLRSEFNNDSKRVWPCRAERVLSNFSGTNAMFGFRTRQHATLRIENLLGLEEISSCSHFWMPQTLNMNMMG